MKLDSAGVCQDPSSLGCFVFPWATCTKRRDVKSIRIFLMFYILNLVQKLAVRTWSVTLWILQNIKQQNLHEIAFCGIAFVLLLTPSESHFCIDSLHSYYHPRMRIGNNFTQVCLCVSLFVCLCVCLCFCLSVWSGSYSWTAIARNFIFSVQVYLDHI